MVPQQSKPGKGVGEEEEDENAVRDHLPVSTREALSLCLWRFWQNTHPVAINSPSDAGGGDARLRQAANTSFVKAAIFFFSQSSKLWGSTPVSAL